MSCVRVPILVYHHVYSEDTPELRGTISEAGILDSEGFRRQMQFIEDEDWNVVSTTELIDWLTKGGALQERSVVLHFDNGWLDTQTVALPILREYGYTGTCFPITDGIEAATGSRSVSVRTLTEGVIEKPFMTWDGIGELVNAGWEIGGHTATHCKVAEMHDAEGDDGVIREMETSHELFESHLGLIPEHFAYPSGSRNQQTDELLSGHYRSLRLWHAEFPIRWSFTDRSTSRLEIDCQNIDVRVSFEDFKRIFEEALAS